MTLPRADFFLPLNSFAVLSYCPCFLWSVSVRRGTPERSKDNRFSLFWGDVVTLVSSHEATRTGLFGRTGSVSGTIFGAILVPALLIPAAVLAGLYAYGLHEWHAADRALDDNKGEEAAHHLEFCLKIWPRSVPVQVLAARAARYQGDLEGCEAMLNRIDKMHGPTSDTQLEFLLLRAQAGEVNEVAPILLREVDNNHPESVLILSSLARAYMHHFNYGRAWSCLAGWIEKAPCAKVYYWRGWVDERLDAVPEAKDDYAKALEYDPDLFDVRLRMAELMLEENKVPEALPHLEALMRRYPNRPEVQARLGHCRILEGKTAEARELLEKAVAGLPDDLPLLHDLSKVEMTDGNPPAAERWLRHALQVDPTDPEALFMLSQALQHQNRADEAQKVMEDYNKKSELLQRINRKLGELARNPSDDPAVLTELGRDLLISGQVGQGIHWLYEALARDPAHPLAHEILAEHYRKKGDKAQEEMHRSWLKGARRTSPAPQGASVP
jgi:tetratricopeptide (TPR) repeat protein